MKKFVLKSVLASVSTPVFVLAGVGLATAPSLLAQAAPATDQITIKDPAEFNSYQNAITQTDPKAKAAASEAFLTQYPQSVVKLTVLNGLVYAYAAFDATKAVDASKRLLQMDPNNLGAMYMIAAIDKQQAATNPAQAAALMDDAAAMAQKGLAATKPADVAEDVFKKQKSQTDPIFLSVIANDDLMSKKDYTAAIADLRKELQYLADNSPDASKSGAGLSDTYNLGQAYTQLTPPDMINAVWFLARADNFAPTPQAKAGIDKVARYWYKRYHGKEEGFEDVLAKAATTIFPPPDFTIAPAPTAKDIADGVVASTTDLSTLAVADKEYILANASPANAEKVWDSVKGQTTLIPPAIVIAATADQIQIAVTDDNKTDKKADFTVNMKTPLTEKEIPAVGAEVKNLIGTYDSYTQTPPQIIMKDGEFQVEKKAPVHKPAAGHKKTTGK
jgi:hypothetical protein